jgi:hypothetical protein
MWEAFERWLGEDPGRLPAHAHPFDAFVAQALADARQAAAWTAPHRWIACAADTDITLDFRTLGHLGGLGHPSRLGLLLHPEHGPWFALRAACVLGETPEDLVPAGVSSAPLHDASAPCIACVATHGEAATPCARACPGAAFGPRGWELVPCARFHVEDTRCATTCHARCACPHGTASRYPSEALTYHSDRALGRRVLRRRLGIENDPHEGDALPWAEAYGQLVENMDKRA